MKKKAIIIDDERPALLELEFLLNTYKEISVVGSFTNPLEALEAIRELDPDVVFLDINMPQLMGIDAASVILDANPSIDIVFVTAFDQYAIEAFEIHATDYLLKPINDQRFENTMERVLKKKTGQSAASSGQFAIKCFGGFRVGWVDQDSIRWRADKTKEIFAFLLQNRHRSISKEELLDQLWPEDDPEKAIRQLYNGIYYIRKALEDYQVGRDIIKIDKDYNVKLGNVELDVTYFYDYANNKGAYTTQELEVIANHYKGDYLQGEYYPWADAERGHLENLYVKCIMELTVKLMEDKQWEKAENYLRKAYSCNPYEEEVSEKLVYLYLETGNKNKAILHYNRYADLIGRELGVKPDPKLQIQIQKANKSEERMKS